MPVEHLHADDQMHGFLLLGSVAPRAAELADRVADSLAGLIGQRAGGGLTLG